MKLQKKKYPLRILNLNISRHDVESPVKLMKYLVSNPYHKTIINMFLWGDSNTHKFHESKDTIRQ